ncbi:hypothetical protein HF670_05080 [Acidithiobacillus thiooxidans]|uniref:Uncharacterized protein n=1 Tax=Acidithiobacillus thiooxidans TaxID=930 RepID=A0A1C2J9A0_ACITH|nr:MULTISPECIES: hypothetical protein [Acidithiobacillus]MBU2742346.1 hypothetical protein [Acidithiobacillus albertensis]MBU2792637.1 hypothetical protein [Acidithiobacillus thiooxidans]MBU2838943.1 hypothetical protein [Acidithiobacillus thiooxidans]MBU2843261.1 hypothetical protein [Acidithiobacillus thiooxidans]OCX70878.1 hypothetical protein A6M23_13045 [Acidithiobacillus thiooxidans]
MTHELLNRQIAAFEDRDTWIAAYAAWYQHFLAMQPVTGRLAEKWAQEMTENTLLHFYLRDDQQEIVQLAMHKMRDTPLAGSEKTLANRKPNAGVQAPNPAPLFKKTASAQISLF